MTQLKLGFFGDDFTGSFDVLLQLARCGWQAELFLDPADVTPTAITELDAVGIAGSTRALPPEDLHLQLSPAFTALRHLQPKLVQYKVSSTGDSSPTVGSIGKAIELGLKAFGEQQVPILVAQPQFGRYTLFGHHFAAEGGTVYRLDRQPTMSTHPSTPMDDSDLATHLQKQTSLPITNLHRTELADAQRVDELLGRQTPSIVVLDSIDDEDVRSAATAILDTTTAQPRFIVGSGGLSLGLAQCLPPLSGHTADLLKTSFAGQSGAAVPVFAVSGSQSSLTRRQIEAAVEAGWNHFEFPWDAGSVKDGIDHIAAELNAGVPVVMTLEAKEFAENPLDLSVELLTFALGQVISQQLVERIIICGGDTSSRIMQELGVTSLHLTGNPAGNLTICAARSSDPALDGLQVALKGGQVGTADYFELIRHWVDS